MFGKTTYLMWLLLFIGIPLLILLRWRHHLRQQRRALALTVLGSLAGGWLWDAIAVRLGLWYYDPANISVSGFWAYRWKNGSGSWVSRSCLAV